MSQAVNANLSAYLAAIVNSSNDAIIGKDLNGIITTWNLAAERTFGYTASEIVGRHISILAAASVIDEMPLILDRIRNGETIAHYETLRRHKNGNEIPVSLTVSPIKDDSGSIIGACKIARDISDRKRAECNLRLKQAEIEVEIAERNRAETRFRLVVEAAPNALIMVAASGYISLLNSQTEKLFGYNREELIGQKVEMLVPERFRSSHDGHRGDFFFAPRPRPMGKLRDLFGLHKDGTEVPIEIGLNPVVSADEMFVLASIVDITERKLFEESLQRAIDEKLALLQEMHHRVKNNLQVICSLLLIQAASVKDPETVAKLKDSEQRVMSMAIIHEQLYSQRDMSSIDLAQYVQNLAARLFSSYATDPRLKYRLNLASARLSIEQSVPCGLILNELITNAIKYAYPNGEGEIKIDLCVEGDELNMSVSDQGRGMPAGFDWENTKSLGMKIVQLLTAQLDGQLVTNPGPGASFTIRFKRLPLAN
jgi:PAS domain S-box-containing protein